MFELLLQMDERHLMIMQRQTEDVMLKKERSIEWLQYERLSVSMWLIIISLKIISRKLESISKIRNISTAWKYWKLIVWERAET